MFYSRPNYWPILYRFRDKGDICAKFPTSSVLNDPVENSPWNFVMAVELEKTRMMPLPDRQKILTIYPYLDTVLALDRQTDRQTDGRTDRQKCPNGIVLCMHCMLTRDKN